MKDFHAVSVSGGKDSSALLLLMIERGMPIDTVLFADTGMEFPEMYDHIHKLDELLYRERGIHITIQVGSDQHLIPLTPQPLRQFQTDFMG